MSICGGMASAVGERMNQHATRLRNVQWMIVVIFYACLPLQVFAVADILAADPVSAGADLIEAGQYAKAYAVLAQANVKDPELPFFTGVALSRLQRYGEALEQFRKAEMMGDKNPDLSFEKGWTLLEVGQWNDAVAELKRYEAQSPGRAQTAEFLGRAYLELGEYENADRELKEALRRDPEVEGVVRLQQAMMASRRHDAAAATSVADAVAMAPGDSLTLRALRPLIVADHNTRPWSLALTLGAGYDTNPRGATGDVPIGGSAAGKPSALIRTGIDAAYELNFQKRGSLTLSYQLQDDTHTRNHSAGDVLDQYWAVQYDRELGGRFSTALRIWDEYTCVDSVSYRNQVGGSATLATPTHAGWRGEMSYSIASEVYLFSFPVDSLGGNALVRDGVAHNVTLAGHYSDAKSGLDFRGGYFRIWNQARGSDFDYDGEGLLAGLSYRLPWEWEADTLVTYTREKYLHRNTASETFKHRGDRLTRGSVRLSRPISKDKRLEFFINYDFTYDVSNVSIYQFEQHVITSGIVWRL